MEFREDEPARAGAAAATESAAGRVPSDADAVGVAGEVDVTPRRTLSGRSPHLTQPMAGTTECRRLDSLSHPHLYRSLPSLLARQRRSNPCHPLLSQLWQGKEKGDGREREIKQREGGGKEGERMACGLTYQWVLQYFFIDKWVQHIFF